MYSCLLLPVALKFRGYPIFCLRIHVWKICWNYTGIWCCRNAWQTLLIMLTLQIIWCELSKCVLYSIVTSRHCHCCNLCHTQHSSPHLLVFGCTVASIIQLIIISTSCGYGCWLLSKLCRITAICFAKFTFSTNPLISCVVLYASCDYWVSL